MIRSTSVRYSDSKTKFTVQTRGEGLVLHRSGQAFGLTVDSTQTLRDLAAFLTLVANDVDKEGAE